MNGKKTGQIRLQSIVVTYLACDVLIYYLGIGYIYTMSIQT